MATRITPCPKCKQEGESELYLTELVCPFCAHEWSVSTGSPFPPEVVERALAAGEDAYNRSRAEDDDESSREGAWGEARFWAHWHVIADYLRSEQARERVRDAVLSNSGGSLGTVATAVISALLGENG